MNRIDLFDAVEKSFQEEMPSEVIDDPSMCYIGGVTDSKGRTIVFCNSEVGGELIKRQLKKMGQEISELERNDPIEKLDELLNKMMAAAKKDKHQDDDPLATMVKAIMEKKLEEKADKSKA